MTFRRFRYLRLCLWLNPRFLFAVAGVIASTPSGAAPLSARPATAQFPAPVLAVGKSVATKSPVPNQIAQSSTKTTVRRLNSRNDCGGKSLLDKIAFIESSGRASAIGDGGKARGAHQMHLAAVLDCGGSRADWLALTNRATSDKFAGAYLEQIKTKLAKAGISQASPAQIYFCYREGFYTAKKAGFDVSKSGRTTKSAVKKFNSDLSGAK